jgi:molybdopterin converting factor small subunit
LPEHLVEHRVRDQSAERGGPVAVEVRLPTVLRSQAGGASVVTVDGATVGEVLAKLVAEYPGMAGQVLTDDGTLHKFVNVYVDDDDVRYLQGLDTPVKDGAEVSLLPAVAGG